MSSEEQRQKEEAASRRHAKLDNAGVLHMSTQAEIADKITIVSIFSMAGRRAQHYAVLNPERQLKQGCLPVQLRNSHTAS